MDKQVTISPRFSYLALVLILIGIATFVFGFIYNPGKTWANLLVNNYYFLSLALGAIFFWALQNVTQSGWSSAFMRVPMAIGNYIPVAFILMLPVGSNIYIGTGFREWAVLGFGSPVFSS